MPSHQMLVEAGFDVDGHSEEFVRALKQGHALHLSLSRSHEALKVAAQSGQKPDFVFCGDLTTKAFRLSPGEGFISNCPGGVVLPPAEDPLVSARTIQAAMHYAVAHLGVRRVVVTGASDALILPYVVGQKIPTGPFMNNWQSAWEPVVAALSLTPHYQSANEQERVRLAGIYLAQLNAERIRESFHVNADTMGLQQPPAIVVKFFDADDQTLDTYTSAGLKHPYQHESSLPNVALSKRSEHSPKAFGCSCCDSRALHTHMYCAEPGDYHELYAIAAIVPDHHEALQRGTPNSAWLQLELAKTGGCENYVVTGHTKCGGIQGLVGWCKTGTPPADQYLAGWLQQAKPIVDDVVAFAAANGFDSDEQKVCRLAEMYVMQWSATNIKRYVGKAGQVLANYLDIETREIYPLPLIDTSVSRAISIDRTHKLVESFIDGKLMTLPAFYDGPARIERRRLKDNLQASFASGPACG